MGATLRMLLVVGICLAGLGWGPGWAAQIVVDSVTPGVGVTLDEAIYMANFDPDPPHTIVFAVEGVYQPPAPLQALLRDGTEIRGELDADGSACVTDSARFVLDGTLVSSSNGLTLQANDCLITGLKIRNFDVGILIAPARQGNQIGGPGTESCERMWLTENGVGLRLGASETNENQVRNCRIYANSGNGIELLGGPSFNVIGVDMAGERNYIYGNGAAGVLLHSSDQDSLIGNQIAGNYIYANDLFGVHFVGDGGDAVTENTISDNWIGIDPEGLAAGNGHGVCCELESPRNYILRNVIVDNETNGVSLLDCSHDHTVSDNWIGVTEAGSPMGNHGFGLFVETDRNELGPDNEVRYNGDGGLGYAGVGLVGGGDVYPEHNTLWESVVSNNDAVGVMLFGTGTLDNVVRHCYIGTDASSLESGNTGGGVLLDQGANANVVHHCVIGCNAEYGVRLSAGASGNEILANQIGTDPLEELNLGNANGVFLEAGANLIGGTSADMGNTIVHSAGWGIRATSDEVESGAYIVHNRIGTNVAEEPLANLAGGIWLGDGFIDNDIGDWPGVARAGNLIMHNGGPGVKIGEAGAANVPVQNRVLTNRICDNVGEPIVLVHEGNDLLPPPIVASAGNAYQLPDGEMIGIVLGQIGFDRPPPSVPVRIQVFYNTPDTCSAFYGQVHVPSDEDGWTLVGDPLPANADIYATETTKGPNPTPQPEMQTSGISEEIAWGWWQLWNELCDGQDCDWLGRLSIGRSASWIDYDRDGWPDLYLANAGGENALLRNMGDGTLQLTDIGPFTAGLANTVAAAWADADNDGDADAYLVHANSPNQLFLQSEPGVFAEATPVALADAGDGRAAAWADYDLDGDLDLFLTNYASGDRLVRNDGAGNFSDQTDLISQPGWEGEASVGAAWADYDEDGDPDLYIADASGANRLYRNEGGLAFTDVTVGPLGDTGAGRGVVWGDFDNDGLLDLYVVNQDGANRLLRNLGPPDYGFVDATSGPEGDPGPGRSVSSADFDLDGDLDLYIVNDPDANVLLANDGAGQFSLIDDVEPMPEGIHFASAPADFDRDGDVELFLVHGLAGGDNLLLMNTQANGHHWLGVDLVGTQSNRDGIGSRIEVTAAGGRATQTRIVTAGTGSMGQGTVTAHFGLGLVDEIAMVRVHWPSGAVSEWLEVAVDQVLLIEEPDPGAVDPDAALESMASGLLACHPNPVQGRTRLGFALQAPAPVSLEIYDTAGRLVRRAGAGRYGAGEHEIVWDGCDPDGRPAPTGVYFVVFRSGDLRQQRMITLVR